MADFINIEGLVSEESLYNISLSDCKTFHLEKVIPLNTINPLRNIYQITVSSRVLERKSLSFKDGNILILSLNTHFEILAVDRNNSMVYLKEDVLFSPSFTLKGRNFEGDIEVFLLNASFELSGETKLLCSLSYLFYFTKSLGDGDFKELSEECEFKFVDITREFF